MYSCRRGRWKLKIHTRENGTSARGAPRNAPQATTTETNADKTRTDAVQVRVCIIRVFVLLLYYMRLCINSRMNYAPRLNYSTSYKCTAGRNAPTPRRCIDLFIAPIHMHCAYSSQACEVCEIGVKSCTSCPSSVRNTHLHGRRICLVRRLSLV